MEKEQQGTQKISESEWRIMKVIWETSPIAASDIIEKLKPESSWSSKTIHTLISRLAAKNILGINKDGPFYLYYPLLTEEECIKEERESFLKRVYDGSFKMLMVDFLKNEKLSAKEIEELQELLKKQ